MNTNHLDNKRYWTPKAVDRTAITDLLVAIKATGSIDSDESIAAQNALLEIYYPTLIKIAETNFNRFRSDNISPHITAEDFVYKAFKSAVRRILKEDITSIGEFNSRFMLIVINSSRRLEKKHLRPSNFIKMEIAARAHENESPFNGEGNEFWAAFKAKLKPKFNRFKMPFVVDNIDWEIID